MGTSVKSMIMNHIVHDLINVEDVKNDELLLTKYNTNKIRINTFMRRRVGSTSTLDDKSPNFYTANCVPIIKINQNAEEGIVHVVDRILPPVTKSLMELIRGREDMTFLQMIVDRTDFAEQLENANKRFTFFAPTDQAFEKLDPRTRQILMEGNACALSK